jgi:hypothetical protein
MTAEAALGSGAARQLTKSVQISANETVGLLAKQALIT